MQKLRPRSPYEKLGGYVHLPRLIDKAKLHRKGLLDGYNYKTVGFDKHLLAFLRIKGDALDRLFHVQAVREAPPPPPQAAVPMPRMVLNRGEEPIAAKTVHRDHEKVGRNDPCPCGSGKKYKKCHGA